LTISHETTAPDLSWIPEEDRPEVGTDCWIERCLHEQRAVPLDEHVCFRPLPRRVPGAEQLKVHVSGYADVETAMFMKRLVRAIGNVFSRPELMG
jgi:DNA replication regulator DPB11